MRKLAFVIALALPLGACSTVQTIYDVATGKVVTPTEVIVAASAFDAVKITATNYLRLPLCPKAPVCRQKAATAPIIAAIRAGTADRNQLKAAVRANPTANLTLIDVFADLQHSTSALGNLIATYNMGAIQ